MVRQLDIFGGEVTPGARLELAALPERVHELAAHLPAQLRLGTSSWSFPGWQGLVWDRPANKRLLAREGLGAYARHPLFRTVGLDRTYYGPMSASELRELAASLPPEADLRADGGADFRFLVKAHAECTTVKFPDKSWYKSRAGQRNELFLEPEYASEVVVRPFLDGLGPRGGVLLFQFPPQHVPGGARSFAFRLRDFLAALPKGPQYAVEIRNPDLLTPRYVQVLEELGATHCVVELPGMPPVRKQWEVSGGPDRPALVMRWMLARKHSYESGKEAYAPFDRLVDPNPSVRRAYAEMILAQAEARPQSASYLIVNNKAEGSSPLSLIGLAEELVQLAA